MIKQEIKNGIVHTYSDKGLKIRAKGTSLLFSNAYEPVSSDKIHEWEEVEEDGSN